MIIGINNKNILSPKITPYVRKEISFSSKQKNQNSDEDSFLCTYRTDRAQASYSLITTYLIMGIILFVLLKSCSNEDKKTEIKSQPKFEQKNNLQNKN